MQSQTIQQPSDKALRTENVSGTDHVVSQMERYFRIRRQTENLYSFLRPEDYMLQTLP